MNNVSEEKKRLQWFSRSGFLFPQIYLLWARQYWLFLLFFLIPIAIDIFIPLPLIWILCSIGIMVFVWIKWRSLAYKKTKRPFADFKKNYKKASKIIIIILCSLLWIIFIWILAGALIPRLTTMRGRANDTARKADIQQVATALVAYQIDHNQLLKTPWSLNNIAKELMAEGMSSIPKDPNNESIFDWINAPQVPWQYMYTPIIKWGSRNSWFVVMAKTETEQWSNRVVWDGVGIIRTSINYENIIPCQKFTIDTVVKNNSGDCHYTTWSQLRYIYVY